MKRINIKFLSGSEEKNIIVPELLISVFFTVVGFFLGKEAGVLILVCCLVFIFIHLIFSYARYKHIIRLTDNITRILHGDYSVRISSFREGETAILESEIQKMLSRLCEQNEALEKERVFLSDSIADISHQLRTPLTSINLIISLLQAGNLSDDRRHQLIMELSALSDKTDRLVTTLLKISKIDAGTVRFEKKRVSVAQLIKKSAEPILVPMDIKNQSLIINADDEFFTGDIGWSTEAVGNILKNAMEHMPGEGTITVDCSQTPIYTQIIISDTGSGFSQEDLPHIFERFYKGNNSSKDSFGIGLNLARMIIQNQNGTVKASNGKNGGAVFTIRFYHTVV